MKHSFLLFLFLLTASAHAGEKVLFLMTAADSQSLQNGKIRQTGYFLNEFYEAYEAVKKAGFEVEFASPNGKTPTIDEEGLKLRYWDSKELRNNALEVVSEITGLQKPFSISEANERFQDYKAIVVPGGQGVLVDLFFDTEAINLVERFGAANKIVGLICHSLALLLKMENNHSFKGFKVTSVS